MQALGDRRIHRLARAIERYLKAHPQAKDSVVGIAGWWLPTPRYRHSTADVKAALDLLVNKGVVISVKSSNGQELFCARHKRDYESL